MFTQVRAVETSTNELFTSDPEAMVQITITDVNDNPPRFQSSLYLYKVKDNLKIGSQLSNVCLNSFRKLYS